MRRVLLYILLLMGVTAWGQCIDFTDLTSSDVVCRYGTFTNPDQNVGVAVNRHTVITDQTAYDDFTVNPANPSLKLKVVPEGETASVRLGDFENGAKAESITYFYHVDKDVNPILLLNYAVVMQMPDHTLAEQPRLTMEITDEHGSMISADCGSFDFIASDALNWNDGAKLSFTNHVAYVNNTNGTKVIWKDWSLVGMDLSDYDGQTVKIKLTNYDCSRKGHLGYTYFTLSCRSKQINVETCGQGNLTTYTAPDGFDYKWYYFDNNNNRVVVSTDQSINVPMNNRVYYCDVYPHGRPDCTFTLSVKSKPRVPMADFQITKKVGCTDTIYVRNMSSVSEDGMVPNDPHEDCDTAVWYLGDGRMVTTYQIPKAITYEVSGTYEIKLVVMLKDGGCVDSISRTVFVHGAQEDHVGDVYASICDDDYYVFNGEKLTKTGLYRYDSKTDYDCDSITYLHLTVNPTHFRVDTAHICDKEFYEFNGRKLYDQGVYTDTLKTAGCNCDSVRRLVLFKHYPYFKSDTATICDNETFNFRGSALNKAGVYQDKLLSNNGCDSIFELVLNVLPTYLKTVYVQLCDQEEFNFRGRLIKTPGVYYDSLLTHVGCDSVYKLVYSKNPTYLFEDTATICANEVYNWRGRQVNKPKVYIDSLQTIRGCDSLYKLTLNVLPRYVIEDTVLVCDQEVYNWRGRVVQESGVYYDSLKAGTGCDSTYILHVQLPVVKDYSAVICDGEKYEFKNLLFSTDGVHLVNSVRCDSLFRLDLKVREVVRDTVEDEICIGDTLELKGETFTKPGKYEIQVTSTNKCYYTTLILNTLATTALRYAYIPDVCADVSEFPVYYAYYGARPATYSIYYNEDARKQGFLDVVDEVFNDTILCRMPTRYNDDYLRPDRYALRLELNNGACQVFSFDVDFLVRYPSWIHEQKWNDVVALLNERYNGGYKWKKYEWFVNGNLVTSRSGSYIYMPQSLRFGDEVHAVLTRVGEDYGVPTCPVTIVDRGDKQETEFPISVYPSYSRSGEVMVSASESGTYVVYSFVGQVVASGVCDAGTTSSFVLPQRGIYLVRLVTEGGEEHVERVVVE